MEKNFIELFKKIYKNKEYINFETLFDNIIKYQPDDLNQHFEFETIMIDETNHTPKTYFKDLQLNENLKLDEVSDNLIIEYKPNVLVENKYFKSYIKPDDACFVKNIDDIKNNNYYLYEIKENFMRINPNNFSSFPISPLIKFSLEQRTNKFELEPFKIHRKLRCSYSSTLPFKFDFTVRYISNKKTLIEQWNELKKLNLNESDVFDPTRKNGFNILYDLEFEYTKDNFIDIYEDFYSLISFVYKDSFDNEFDPVYQKINEKFNLNNAPGVGILTNHIIQTTENLNNFVWLEKTDGIRYFLILIDNKIYSYSKTTGLKEIVFPYHSKVDKLTIFDTELYEDKYKIFDIVCVNGIDVTQENYLNRMKNFDKLDFSSKHIVLKKFYPLKSWSEIIEFSKNIISPISNEHIDGVVLQTIDLPYDNKTPTVFKLKPYRLNTIDFKLMWSKVNKCFYLYLIGSAMDLIYNLRFLPHNQQINKEFFDYDMKNLTKKQRYYILFETPYFANTYKFYPNKYYDLEEYTEEERYKSLKIMKDMNENSKNYNGKIYEMSFSKNGWIPLRCREDKMFPNSFKTGLANMSILFSPPTANLDLYFSKKLAFDENTINLFHETNRIIRTFIFDKFINDSSSGRSYLLKKFNSCVDLCGGRGADLKHLFKAGCNKIFAIDADKEALITYTQKASMNLNKPFEHVLAINDKNIQTRLTFNAIHSVLSSDNRKMLQELNNRIEYKTNSIDLIVMNYAFHYICSSFAQIIELKNNMIEMLTNDGFIILTFYDGEKIYEQLLKSKVYEISNFKIEQFYPKSKEVPIELQKYVNEKEYNSLLEVLGENLSFDKIEEDQFNRIGCNQIIFNQNKEYELKFKSNYTKKEIKFLTDEVERIFSNSYENLPYAKMPLPTISSDGYKSEPLVLQKHINLLLDDFEIVEIIYPMLNYDLRAYFSKNNIDTFLNPYLNHIKTILLRKK